MGITEQAKPGADNAGGALRQFFGRIGAFFTFPVAILFALTGQTALGSLIMALTPPVEPGDSVSLDGALWAQAILLVAQGAALVIAIFRTQLRASRVYYALVAFVWAIASILLVYVAFECHLGGVCL